MSIGICKRGHVTGFKLCWCGAQRVAVTGGDGKVKVTKDKRPRGRGGRNALDMLRAETRVSGGGHTIPHLGGILR